VDQHITRAPFTSFITAQRDVAADRLAHFVSDMLEDLLHQTEIGHGLQRSQLSAAEGEVDMMLHRVEKLVRLLELSDEGPS
jgi:hypothetical protein